MFSTKEPQLDWRSFSNTAMRYRLVKQLDTDSLHGAVQEFLAQSLLSCEAGESKLMLTLALSAGQVAYECHDQLGEAAALIHLGTAYLQTNQLDQARKAYEHARHIYRCDPAWRQRHNEGLALYGLGLVCQQENPPSQIKAIAYYEKALTIFASVQLNYSIAGSDQQLQAVIELCDELREGIAAHIPRVFIDVEAQLPPPTDQSETSSQHSNSDVLALSNDGDEKGTGAFGRNDQGIIWFTDLDT